MSGDERIDVAKVGEIIHRFLDECAKWVGPEQVNAVLDELLLELDSEDFPA